MVESDSSFQKHIHEQQKGIAEIRIRQAEITKELDQPEANDNEGKPVRCSQSM